jgi:CheY-like chemotaxis protein
MPIGWDWFLQWFSTRNSMIIGMITGKNACSFQPIVKNRPKYQNVYLISMKEKLNGFHLLIADDDEEDIEIFMRALSETGFNVNCTFAKDGIEALTQLTTNVSIPDMVFLDLNMPRMGGEECLKQIRQMQKFEPVPVIIYTTSSYPGEKERLMFAGASQYLTKEFSFQKIVDQIAGLLGEYSNNTLQKDAQL